MRRCPALKRVKIQTFGCTLMDSNQMNETRLSVVGDLGKGEQVNGPTRLSTRVTSNPFCHIKSQAQKTAPNLQLEQRVIVKNQSEKLPSGSSSCSQLFALKIWERSRFGSCNCSHASENSKKLLLEMAAHKVKFCFGFHSFSTQPRIP